MSDESHRERAKQLVEYAVITGGVTTGGLIIDSGLCSYRAMLQGWTQIRLENRKRAYSEPDVAN